MHTNKKTCVLEMTLSSEPKRVIDGHLTVFL